MRWAAVAILLAGCGRLAFDARSDGLGDGSDALIPGFAQLAPGASLWLAMETDPAVGIVDSAGGHTVTCTSSCPISAAGKHGKGFATASSQLTVAFAPDLSAAGDLTAAAWVRIEAFPTSGGFSCAFSKPHGGVGSDLDSFDLCVDDTMMTYAYFGNLVNLSGASLPLGQWHHLAFTYATATNTARIYFDGTVANSTIAANTADGDPLLVGADNQPPAFFWQGELDDVVFYGRVLTQSELQMLALP